MASQPLTFKPLSQKVPVLKYQTSTSCSMKQSLGSQIRYCGSHLKRRRGDNQAYILCSSKFPNINQLYDFSKIKMYMDYVKGRVLEFAPEPVKRFPFKKAADVALQQLLTTGREALKLSLVAVFIFGSLSDIISSISRNEELLVPFGLLVGCTIAEFLKDVSHEFFNNKEENVTWCLLGMSCVFILLKSIAIQLPVKGLGFVVYVVNGALMQVLWHLKSSGEICSVSTRHDATDDESLATKIVEV